MPDPTPHVPTDITRAEVAALSSFGNTQAEIALYLGICVDTLTKYYRYELDTAVVRANAMVARKLYNKAVVQDDLSAQVFWLKTRGRWRTADNQTVVESNESLQQEVIALRKQLDAKNKRDY